jgi:hypothetical protein
MGGQYSIRFIKKTGCGVVDWKKSIWDSFEKWVPINPIMNHWFA